MLDQVHFSFVGLYCFNFLVLKTIILALVYKCHTSNQATGCHSCTSPTSQDYNFHKCQVRKYVLTVFFVYCCY